MAKKTSRRTSGTRGSRKASRRGPRAGRRTARAKSPKGKAARKKAAPRKRAAPRRKPAATKARARKVERRRPAAAKPRPKRRGPSTTLRAGGAGREETLAQTPESGRTVRGRTNPMPTRRSTGTAAGAGGTRMAPGLERQRKQLREVEETVPTPPSSLDLSRAPSAARTGRQELREAREKHHETSPAMTGGDVDADWEDAYSVGDEAPGGDNPTPDQDRVDDIGKALGVEYQDNEELKAADKIAERDRKRWELDPASSEDYKDRD